MNASATALWVLMTFLLGLSSGCLIIPTPESDSGNARANLNPQSITNIQPAITTIQDVILALGEPDAVSPDERKLVYRSEKIVGVWFIAGGYNADGGVLTRDRYLLIELDERGVVQSRKLSAPWFPSTPDRLMKTSETLTKPEHEP
jgi:hypothetical protein